MSEPQWLMFDFVNDAEEYGPWPDTPAQRRQASAAEVRTAASQAEVRAVTSASED
jgi:hypothetical protein